MITCGCGNEIHAERFDSGGDGGRAGRAESGEVNIRRAGNFLRAGF